MNGGTQPIVECISDLDDLEHLREAWDALACALGRPFAAPDWLLAWARHVAPADATFRVIACWADGELVALVPLWAVRRLGMWRYRTFGGPNMAVRGACLISPDAPAGIGDVLGGAIAALTPRPAALTLSQIDRASPLPDRLAGGWPARLGVTRRTVNAAFAPTVHLHPDGFDAWMATRTRNFRGQVRRRRRRAERDGCVVSPAVAETRLDAALDAFDRLHGAQWGSRSALTTAGAKAMLREAAAALAPASRLRVATVSHGDDIVGVDVFVAAGSRIGFWNGAWDPARSDLSPGFVVLSAAIDDAHRRGEFALDLGEGGQRYKMRFADDPSPIVSVELRPRGWRGLLLAFVEDAPGVARRCVAAARRAVNRTRAHPTGEGQER